MTDRGQAPAAHCAAATLDGLPPEAGRDAEILILGSMPGPLSLARHEYYAHPRNAFWPISAALFGFAAAAPYRERLAALRARRVALWDVVGRCRRAGAADTAIRDAQANDFAAFFAAHRRLRLVCFNGGTAARLFRQLVAADALVTSVQCRQLPSTSPAYAAMPFAEKLACWRRVLVEPPAAGAAARWR